MGKMYTVVFTGVAVTAQQDLFEITSASTRVLMIHGFELSQSTEVGDAQEEVLSVLVKRGQTTSGSGGTAPTPTPLETNQGAAAFAAEVNNTTKASTGTIVTIHSTNWNVRQSPCTWLLPPEWRIAVGPSERLTVELATTPADSITMSGTMWVEEIG